jgi:hypothetical protein
MCDDAKNKQIYERLNLRKTEELLDIWVNNDRVEWADLTFEIIHEILRERAVELPAQNGPVYMHQLKKKVKITDKLKESLGIGDYAVRFETTAMFYKPRKVFMLQKWINWTMVFVILSYGIRIIVSFAELIRSQFNTTSFVLHIISSLIQIAIPLIALIGLSYILKILMQFEFNSRAPSMKNTETAGDD